ncbi:MAG: UDP-N-acetylmuramoyl-L-alanyl-D-glutamate--2,6-diaminopimelate ligase [Alphaproteobacteria bacterium]|nr:UDP-N-acetylmuramoyl-L-alanyl-D-glutamate--2,6-diaminopimelate ligase [Alphaproteobacteria bacterium]
MTPQIDTLQDVQITGLTADSRQVEPGYLFAALPSATQGSGSDGRAYIGDALARGAVAVLAQPGTVVDDSAQLVVDENPRRQLAHLAARFYQRQPKTVAAVTGTNGKSSVVGFTRQIWSHLGLSTASIGTLGIDADGWDTGPSLTTPDPVALHRTLAALAEAGVNHLAIEASSHGLDQNRLDGVNIAAAAFTNLTRDHLDYHQTEAQYFAAKARLFEQLLPADGTAVLNADSPYYEEIRDICRQAGHRISSYGLSTSDMRIDDLSPLTDGLRLCVTIAHRTFETRLPLVGAFQAYNALAALGLAIGCGASVDDAFAALALLKGVRGRMQLIGQNPNGAPVYIDYAHTPDALETALTAIRPHVDGRLTVVFGAGGDRDAGKRAMMGKVATQFADRAIVTDDNPRREDPASIRRQILTGCPAAAEIDDRAKAIGVGISTLDPEDAVIIAGKGHETGQIVGTQVLPFDDAVIAREIILELGGKAAT